MSHKKFNPVPKPTASAKKKKPSAKQIAEGIKAQVRAEAEKGKGKGKSAASSPAQKTKSAASAKKVAHPKKSATPAPAAVAVTTPAEKPTSISGLARWYMVGQGMSERDAAKQIMLDLPDAKKTSINARCFILRQKLNGVVYKPKAKTPAAPNASDGDVESDDDEQDGDIPESFGTHQYHDIG